MPVTLKLTFPGGRYHATPWGRHVNEGVPEWPPSPWRLLRALVAVWKRTLPNLTEEQVKRVLTALADPPVFHLPPHKVAHTRHAMSMNVIARNYRPSEAERKAGKFQGDPSIVFDTFVVVGRDDPLYVHWPSVALTVDDEVTLRRLVAHLTSLGRAEGWVEAEVVSFPEGERPPEFNCAPAADADPNPVPLLCPDGAAAFADEHYPKHDPKKLKQGKVNPKDFLFDCPRWHLCLDTETIHDKKWPRVPGAKWVNYAAPQPPAVAAPKRSAPDKPRPTVARFLLDGPVLPLVTDTVLVAEAVRRAVMGRFGKWCERNPAAAAAFLRPDGSGKFASPTLSGKDPSGNFLRSHGHAHYLPTAEVEAGDGRRVTHVTVWARNGFGPGEVAALTGLRSIKLGEGDPLRVQLVGLGVPSDFTAEMFRASAVWVSATPVVGPAHAGRAGRDRAFQKSVRREIRRLVEHGVWDTAPEITYPDPEAGGRSPRPIEYRRSRSRGGAPAGWNRPFGSVRLTFPKPVSGPVCVGYGSHYGLGRFAPK